MRLKPGKTDPTIEHAIDAPAAGKHRHFVGRNPDGTSRFRGAGRGKKDYVATDGHNPTRTANGGRVV